MNTIRRIGVWSCAKVYAVVGLLTGGLLGGLIILATLFGGAAGMASGLTGMEAGTGIFFRGDGLQREGRHQRTILLIM